ncbi:MAG: VWA domain-containing protein [Marmoricola sp.]
MSTARYSRYSGGPDPLAPPVDLAEALEAIGSDVMAGYSPQWSMREFLRRGGQGQTGLDELANRVQQRRRELLSRHSLDGTLREVKELLDRAVLEERRELARNVDLDDTDRALSEMQMANVPDSPAAAVKELADYAWHSPQARADFEKIKDLLGREFLDQRFQGMKQALEGATAEDRAAVQQMMQDLNELLEKRRLGEDSPEDFEDFMAKHGQFFPENPQNLDQLMDALAKRSAAAQRMLNSMSAEQRAELMALSAQAFGTPELMSAMNQLDDHLRALRPGEDWSGSAEFDGDSPLGLGEGTQALEDLADLDALSEQLAQGYRGANLGDVDLDALARQLGDDAVADARTLQELERALQETGYLKNGSDGQLRLSPKAMRQLGKALLRDAAARLSNRGGQRDSRLVGAAGDLSGSTRSWEFGDTEPWDVPRTIGNAVLRQGRGVGAGVRIQVDDIEVAETEARTQAAVALLVDTSYSMALDGRWVPMKRTALALHHLVSTRFRGDHLQLIGFGRHAEVMSIEQLIGLDAMWAKGTNLHHGLLLANRHFRKHSNSQPVLLIVTDGEPTAHLESSGDVAFAYPPHPVTVALSVRELDNARRLGAQTTFFRLGEDPGLAAFVDRLAKRVEGSVVAPELDDLGAAVVGSYLGSRAQEPYGGVRGSDWFGGDRGFWFNQ